jgi:hypothetical protein
MPDMADITVKEADGTTDITWTAKQPSSPGAPAVWESDSVGTSKATRPRFELGSMRSKNGILHVNGKISYPSIITDAGGNNVPGSVSFINFHAAIAEGSYDTDVDELAAQATNLIDSTLINAVLKTGYAPT